MRRVVRIVIVIALLALLAYGAVSWLFVSSLRGGFDARDPALADSIRNVRSPVLLIYSRQDGFTPVEHAKAIYAHSDRSKRRDW